jgi:hypothetical protein
MPINVEAEEAKLDAEILQMAANRKKADDDALALDLAEIEQGETDENIETETDAETTDEDNQTAAEAAAAAGELDADETGEGTTDADVDVELDAKREKRVKDFQRKMTKATDKAAKLEEKVAELEQLIIEGQRQKGAKGEDAVLAAGAVSDAVEAGEEDVVEMTDEFEEIKKEFPEISAPLKKLFDGLNKQIVKLKGDLTVAKINTTQSVEESAQFIHDGKIELAHKNFKKTVESDEFDSYLEGLRPQMRKFADHTMDKGNAAEIIELLDDYKATTKVSAKSAAEVARQAKLDAAKAVATPSLGKKSKDVSLTTKPKLTERIINNMSNAEFEAREDEIDTWRSQRGQ